MSRFAIYHNADLDGITCGALAKIKFPDITLIGYDYKQPLDEIEAIPDGSEVYMMDISLHRADMLQLGQRCTLTWIDHHKSAIADVFNLNTVKENFAYRNPVDWLSAYCEVGRAACELVMEFFELEKLVIAEAVQRIGMYDTWRKNEGWNLTLALQFGFRAMIGLDVEEMVKFLKYQTRFSITDVASTGKHILSYQREQARQVMQNSFECTMAVSFPNPISVQDTEEEFDCIAVNAMGLNTEVIPHNIDGKVFLQFIYQENDLWKISMRSEGDLDVGRLCARLGGGGHKNAAGCILEIGEKMERFWEFKTVGDKIGGFLTIEFDK